MAYKENSQKIDFTDNFGHIRSMNLRRAYLYGGIKHRFPGYLIFSNSVFMYQGKKFYAALYFPDYKIVVQFAYSSGSDDHVFSKNGCIVITVASRAVFTEDGLDEIAKNIERAIHAVEEEQGVSRCVNCLNSRIDEERRIEYCMKGCKESSCMFNCVVENYDPSQSSYRYVPMVNGVSFEDYYLYVRGKYKSCVYLNEGIVERAKKIANLKIPFIIELKSNKTISNNDIYYDGSGLVVVRDNHENERTEKRCEICIKCGITQGGSYYCKETWSRVLPSSVCYNYGSFVYSHKPKVDKEYSQPAKKEHKTKYFKKPEAETKKVDKKAKSKNKSKDNISRLDCCARCAHRLMNSNGEMCCKLYARIVPKNSICDRFETRRLNFPKN